MVRELIQAGADINYGGSNRPVRELNDWGREGLPICAAWRVAGATADKLSNSFGWTPLMTAAMGGHLEVVKLLLQSGADVTTKSYAGNTAIVFAERNGHTDVVALLFHF